MSSCTSSSTIRQRNANDRLIISWAEQLAQIDRDLTDAYWSDDEPEIEKLRNRLQIARGMIEQGEEVFVLF
jgi:hypothetical protein